MFNIECILLLNQIIIFEKTLQTDQFYDIELIFDSNNSMKDMHVM